MPAKNNKKWYFLGISLVLALLLIWGFWPRTTCITFLRAGKPIPDLKVHIVISNARELSGREFQTNHLGQIFIPRPSEACHSPTTMTFSNGDTKHMDLIFRQVKWMSYDFGANGKLTTSYPGFIPWLTITHIQQ